MSLCGEVEQNEEISFHAYDNLKRTNATVTALVHLGQESKYLDVSRVPDTFNQYQFKFSHRKRGVAILEVFFDGVQIPESPFRIGVIDKECQVRGTVSVSLRKLARSYDIVQNFPNSPHAFHHRTKMEFAYVRRALSISLASVSRKVYLLESSRPFVLSLLLRLDSFT